MINPSHMYRVLLLQFFTTRCIYITYPVSVPPTITTRPSSLESNADDHTAVAAVRSDDDQKMMPCRTECDADGTILSLRVRFGPIPIPLLVVVVMESLRSHDRNKTLDTMDNPRNGEQKSPKGIHCGISVDQYTSTDEL